MKAVKEVKYLLDNRSALSVPEEVGNNGKPIKNYPEKKDLTPKEELQLEAMEENTDFDVEDGDCKDCGEPLNNGEGDYCHKCLVSRAENYKDDL